jgi:hypothetical protein
MADKKMALIAGEGDREHCGHPRDRRGARRDVHRGAGREGRLPTDHRRPDAGIRAAGVLEAANMFQFYSDSSEYFTGVRNLDLVRELNPELQTLGSWLTQHKNEIPLD